MDDIIKTLKSILHLVYTQACDNKGNEIFYLSNNTLLFETPRHLRSIDDYHNLMNDVEYEDALSYAQALRPSTKWIVQRIICVMFDVYKMRFYVIFSSEFLFTFLIFYLQFVESLPFFLVLNMRQRTISY